MVRGDPLFWLDEHRKVARMDRLLHAIARHPFRNHRVESNNAELLSALVLVCMVESGLVLRAVVKQRVGTQ